MEWPHVCKSKFRSCWRKHQGHHAPQHGVNLKKHICNSLQIFHSSTQIHTREGGESEEKRKKKRKRKKRKKEKKKGVEKKKKKKIT